MLQLLICTVTAWQSYALQPDTYSQRHKYLMTPTPTNTYNPFRCIKQVDIMLYKHAQARIIYNCFAAGNSYNMYAVHGIAAWYR